MPVGTFNTLVDRALGGEGSQYPKPLETSYTHTHTSEGSETFADEYLARRIQICRVLFIGAIVSLVLKIKRSKNEHRKWNPEDLNFLVRWHEMK